VNNPGIVFLALASFDTHALYHFVLLH
jgi:hypothetical protein